MRQSSLPPSVPKVFSIPKRLKTKTFSASTDEPPWTENCDRLAELAGLAMATSVPAARRLCFAVFELDLRAGELRKRGVKLHLQGQPLQVLAALLNRAGDVVTREELRAHIWTADTFVDFDHSLHNAIARLREALGDSAETPRYIETLPRRGYRFIGKVEEVASQPPELPPHSQPGNEAPTPRRNKSRAALALAFLTLVAVGLVLWLVPMS